MKKYTNKLEIKKVWKQVRNQKRYGNKLKMELEDYKQRVIIERKLALRISYEQRVIIEPKLALRHLLSLF